MRDGRLRRFIGGLSLGYIQMAATIVTGLWMTPFLLRTLGSQDYGLWPVSYTHLRAHETDS